MSTGLTWVSYSPNLLGLLDQGVRTLIHIKINGSKAQLIFPRMICYQSFRNTFANFTIDRLEQAKAYAEYQCNRYTG